MPKFFVVSDTHGFCTLTKKALDEAGFERDNPDHWINQIVPLHRNMY